MATKTEQHRKHGNQIHLWSLAFTVIILLLVTSAVYADGSSSVITLISASLQTDQFGQPLSSNGNALFSSVSYDGKTVAFDSKATDMTNPVPPNPLYSDIFISAEGDTGVRTITQIAGENSVDPACDNGPDRCNSGYPVISRYHQGGNDPNCTGSDCLNTYDIAFSSSGTLLPDGLNSLCAISGSVYKTNCKNIFLAKVDIKDPTNPDKLGIQRVSESYTNGAENGNSGYQDTSLLTSTNVLHPVASVYESEGLVDNQGHPVADQPDVNGAMAGDAVVVFESDASNLVTGDGNKHKDIFLRDMGDPTNNVAPGPTVRLTKKGYDGKEPNGDSSNPVITADGKYVAFVSTATNLVNLGQNPPSTPQVYLLDIANNNKIYLVSGPSLNSAGNGESRYPSIIDNDDGSGNGNNIVEVAFHSTSTNLPGGATNGIANIYVFSITIYGDGSTPTTQPLEMVSRGSTTGVGNPGPAGDTDSLTPYLSSDGGSIAFSSYADNLVENANNYDCPPITLHGQQVTKCKDIYVRDLTALQTWRVSLTSSGEQAQSNSAFPNLSGNGEMVSFTSYVDIFGNGGQTYHIQVYQRDQGDPVGNPNIQPASWSFYAQANQASSRTFTITTLDYLGGKTLQSLDYGNPSYPGTTYAGLTMTGDGAGSFVLDKGECTDGLVMGPNETCTFKVTFTAPADNSAQSAILYVPINDAREAIAISLHGQTIVSYMPLFQVH